MCSLSPTLTGGIFVYQSRFSRSGVAFHTGREMAWSRKSFQCAALIFSIVRVRSRAFIGISVNGSLVLRWEVPSVHSYSAITYVIC